MIKGVSFDTIALFPVYTGVVLSLGREIGKFDRVGRAHVHPFFLTCGHRGHDMKDKFIEYIRNLPDDELEMVITAFFNEVSVMKTIDSISDLWCEIYDEAEINGMIDPEKGTWFDRVDGLNKYGFKHFSDRTLQVLERQNIYHFYQIAKYTPLQIRHWKGSGMRVMKEIKDICSEIGIKLKEDIQFKNNQ